MDAAIALDTSSWARFSPAEAKRIMKALDMRILGVICSARLGQE